MKWDWLGGGGMWAEPDPHAAREYHTIWQDIKILAWLAVRYGCGAILVWVLVWPVVAISMWWEGRGDAVLNGPLTVGYVWVVPAIVLAWIFAGLLSALRAVPSWAWLIIIPLFGIWRHMAALNKRAEAQERPTDAPPR